MPARRATILARTDGAAGLTPAIIRRLPVLRHHRPAIMARRPEDRRLPEGHRPAITLRLREEAHRLAGRLREVHRRLAGRLP
jgi:hypothetical protein